MRVRLLAVSVLFALSCFGSIAAVLPENSPNTNSPPSRSPKRPVIVSWPATQVLKLHQANVDDGVILAYIYSYPHPFDLQADEILRLTQQGVPPHLITAMLHHVPGTAQAVRQSQSISTNEMQVAPQQPSAPSESEPPVDSPPAPAPPPNPPASSYNMLPNYGVSPGVVYGQSIPPEVKVFYQALSEYGTWLNLLPYGWCWQPYEAAINLSWRPDFHNGRWLFADEGWYWFSFYPWGWAPFHFGQWAFATCGWVWLPDTLWKPYQKYSPFVLSGF